MYLFHGAKEKNAINIINNGFKSVPNLKGSNQFCEWIKGKKHMKDILYYPEEPWIYFYGPVNFFSNKPHLVGLNWEERVGSNPRHYATMFNFRKINEPGSLIILNIPSDKKDEAIVRIFNSNDVEKYYPFDEKDFAKLEKRKLKKPSENCQILIDNRMVNDFILFGFRIWDGNDIVKKFNPKYQRKIKHKKKNFNSLIWNEIFKLTNLNIERPFYRKYK